MLFSDRDIIVIVVVVVTVVVLICTQSRCHNWKQEKVVQVLEWCKDSGEQLLLLRFIVCICNDFNSVSVFL